MNSLEKENEYYLKNQDELVKKYLGRFLIIKDLSVVGSFDSEKDAYEQATQKHELGTFLIKYCQPKSKDTPQIFHSRVIVKN